ncbi:three component ABC system middle component [Aurantimonas coralicida]|uniref:three component ABC system middle component n=1 Tax=Aurantimonas coralicida TaxID=182270 RepID=UPI00239F44FD|nr:three component ABC system middle component [Aurantimonas coralicida]MDE0925035.1 DUF6521 family protein [Aurantimonas coralicida]
MTEVGLPRRPLSDLAIVQNPGLGAFALWRFGQGFQADDEHPAPFALSFLVLPIILHRATLDIVTSTKRPSGLALFAAKLGKEREQLLAVHERALLLRALTLQSIAVGVSGRLLSVDYKNATLRANTLEPKPKKLVLPERLKQIGPASEKLGFWFSKLGTIQVANLLRVEF